MTDLRAVEFDQKTIGRLRTVIDRALDTGSLEAHICVVVLEEVGGLSWETAKARLTSHAAPTELIRPRPQDVALLGARLRLGLQVAPPAFTEALERELRRKPLPPAASVHDDERLLLGVAAGIGKVGGALPAQLLGLVDQRLTDRSHRRHLVAQLARLLADDGVVDPVAFAATLLSTSEAPVTDEERVTRLLLGSKALTAHVPGGVRASLAALVAGDAQHVQRSLQSHPPLKPLDAAVLLAAVTLKPDLRGEENDLDSKPAGQGVRRAVVLTALADEYDAVRKHLQNPKVVHHRNTIYRRGSFDGVSHHWDVLVAEIGDGNDIAASETEKALAYFEPDIVLFVGVAGGVKDVRLGDVVVGEFVYGYETGKDTKHGFTPRGKSLPASYALVQVAREARRDNQWHERLAPDLRELRPEALVKPIAAGEKVVASTRSSTFKFLRSEFSDVVAVEMEGRGLMRAAHAAQVQAAVIRGISDLIDGKSAVDDQGWQARASATASAFAFAMLSLLVLAGSK